MIDSIHDLTFGVELECIMPSNMNWAGLANHVQAAGLECAYEGYTHALRDHWKVVPDGSLLGNGAELVSPVLKGADGFRQLRAVCAALESAGCTINRSCGLHVHVSTPDRDLPLQFWKNLLSTYQKWEPVIDTLVSRSRRGGNNSYCREVRYTPAMRNARDYFSLARAVSHHPELRRYHKVNVEAFQRHRTVEFRQHQGTLSGEKAERWVRFCLKMVLYSLKAQPVDQPRGRQGSNVTITVLSSNPHEYGTISWRRFELFRTGMTLAQVRAAGRAAGMSNMWVNWYVARGELALNGAVTPAQVDRITNDLPGLMTLIDADPDDRSWFARRQAELSGAAGDD